MDGTEFDLVLKFRDAKLKKDTAKQAAEEAEAEFDKTENDLIDLLTAKNATKTATYDGVGSVTLIKPRVYASVLKENQDKLFAFLRIEAGRSDLIKEVVNAQSLSSFVKDELESGKGVPEFISYFLKSSARFNAPKES